MARALTTIFVLVALFAASGYYLYNHSRGTTGAYSIARPFRATIVNKIVANGAIVPRQEVNVKPQISGVVERLLVERGEVVRAGELLAVVRPLPDPSDISAAETELSNARLRRAFAGRELRRNARLHARGVLSDTGYDALRLDMQLAKQGVAAALRNLEIVQTGTSLELGRSASEVRATVAGMVMDRPVEVGAFVIETNEFNAGTNVMTLADMSDLIFKGQVDEPDAGRLRVGMPLSIKVGAFPDETFKGRLEFIAPKATTGEGGKAESATSITTFEIGASFTREPGRFVRAGYSATAEAVVDRCEDVLAIKEAYLRFKARNPFVIVQTRADTFEKRAVDIGLSNGIVVEIVSGLAKTDRIRVD